MLFLVGELYGFVSPFGAQLAHLFIQHLKAFYGFLQGRVFSQPCLEGHVFTLSKRLTVSLPVVEIGGNVVFGQQFLAEKRGLATQKAQAVKTTRE